MRIGEVADAVGINPRTIRYYEDIGLLPAPERTRAGYRDYTGQDVDRLVFVKTAQRLGFTLAEVAEVLAFRERGEPPCAYVRGVLRRHVRDLGRRIAELQDLRDELVALDTKAAGLLPDDACYCSVIEHAAAPAPIPVRTGGSSRRPDTTPPELPARRSPGDTHAGSG